MNIDKFVEKFKILKKKGYVKSHRKGPTGIGHTLEQELGMKENNIALPDIKGAELKAHRSGATSMITLFTFNRKCWIMKPLEAIKKYGSKDSNGRIGLYYTMSFKPNSAGLFLDVEKDKISILHKSGKLIVNWDLKTLSKRFESKIPALILVNAETEERDGIEYFRFTNARLLKGTSPELLYDQFREQNIQVDLRLHEKGTMARNHGTGFRAKENKLIYLFKETKIIA
ncbi:MAG: hypothetical protein HY959_04220 [Ignavibacteriae bacterium]|nr:hypothetical protein [Ignavibacteriota bacterium]